MYGEQIQFCQTWQDVLAILEKKYGASATVCVFPTGAMQYTRAKIPVRESLSITILFPLGRVGPDPSDDRSWGSRVVTLHLRPDASYSR